MSTDTEKLEVRYGLPREVVFCKKCVMSNQRPSSTVEFKYKGRDDRKAVIYFDGEGVCSACRFHDMKWNGMDWKARHQMLIELLDRHRSKDGSYDVVVPGSGGKDSTYVSHVLKYKYGMHPLTVTWPPHMYTEIGRKNFEAWLDTGMANITFHPNNGLYRRLTREAFQNLLHPFQPFIVGQKQIGPKMALKYGIKLIMYGESQGEAGADVAEAMKPLMNPKYYSVPQAEQRNLRLGGRSLEEILAMGFDEADIHPYLPVAREDVEANGIEVHHMGFYEHWINQEKFYYAVENGGFTPNSERTEGTFTKYVGLDDKLDGFHFYTTLVKFGIGRASYEASQDIRNRHITREEGVALVRRYDEERPKKYFRDFLEYTEINEDTFWKTIDSFRSPHLWHKVGNEWKLRHQVE